MFSSKDSDMKTTLDYLRSPPHAIIYGEFDTKTFVNSIFIFCPFKIVSHLVFVGGPFSFTKINK